MANLIKRHWFGIFILLIALFYISVILIVVSSPRTDKLNRGFIPCTKVMMEDIFACSENKALCMSGAIVKNSWCDVKVIFGGMKLWIDGKQSKPWSNYFFVPEPLNKEINQRDDEELEEYYRQYPDIKYQMEQLEQESQKLEQKIKEIKDETRLPE